MDIRHFLVAPLAYIEPEKALDGLNAPDAERRINGAAHSIAELVAHMSYWQEWFHARCLGKAVPPAATAAEGWPAVSAGAWPDIRARFLSELYKIADFAANADVTEHLSPAIEFPPLAQYTVGDALVHVATHNSHHMGQVILLRQILGVWPPPAGSFTW